MGGQTTSKQAQNFIQTTVSETVNRTLNTVERTIKMDGNFINIMTDIDMQSPAVCPPGSMLRVDLSQKIQVDMKASVVFETLNKSSLTNDVINDIQGKMKEQMKTSQDGMFAFLKDVHTDQDLNVSSETRQRIENVIENKIQTYMEMTTKARNEKSRMNLKQAWFRVPTLNTNSSLVSYFHAMQTSTTHKTLCISPLPRMWPPLCPR